MCIAKRNKMKIPTQTIPINEIISIDRQRLDYGDIDGLMQSLSTHGLIQPIILTEDKRLIAGGRRLEAATRLGWTSIPVVYRESMSQEDLHILELEENVRRREETWQERCLHIATIHRLKQKNKAIDGETWGQRETAELLGVDSVREINHALKMARLLEDELDENKKPKPDAKYWPCETISEAFRLLFRTAQEQAQAELAKIQAQRTASHIEVEEEPVLLGEFDAEPTTVPPSVVASVYEDVIKAQARLKYLNNPHNDPAKFEEYYAYRQGLLAERDSTVWISKQLLNVDCIKFMHENPARFDHIITDIPYGIDLEMISQSNNTFRDIDTVEELHKVDYNIQLIADFFPAAYATLKDKGFCVTWGDQTMWQHMYDSAIKAGFAVQRWPIIWHKNTAMNSCVAYNTTKNFEIAIVCRKKGTTIARQPNTSIFQTGKDELTNAVDHPFGKPFALWEFLIDTFTLENESVLEPFAGRGTGVISLLRKNRNVIGTELDTKHYNALLENVKQLYYLPLNPNYIFK